MHPWAAGPTGEPFELHSHSPQAVGLRGWWPCLDSRGVNCLEERWAGLRGAFGASTAAPTWANTGDQGWALDFASASSQYVDCGDRAAWDFASESFAVSFWFRTTSTGLIYLAAKYSTAGSAGWVAYMASGATAGRLRFFIQSTGSAYLERRTSNAYNDGAWHHALCVGSWSGSAYSVRIYIDGIQDDIASASLGSPANLAVAQPLRFGSASNGANYYNGQLRDFRIYRADLGLNEARHLWSPESRWDLYRLLRRPVRVITGAGDALIKSLSETLALTEGRSLGIARALAETLALTDARTLAAAKGLTDVLALTDIPAFTCGKNLTEALTLSDTLTALLLLVVDLSETLSLADGRSLSAVKALTETLALNDAQTLAVVKVLTEVMAFADARTLSAEKGLADALTLVEGRSCGAIKSLNETVTLSDTATLLLLLILELGESLLLTDSRTAGAAKALTESLGLTDARSLVFSKTAAESITLTDAGSRGLAKALADALGLDDARTLEPGKLLVETVSFTDAVEALRTLGLDLGESLTFTDGRSFDLAKALIEALALSDRVVLVLPTGGPICYGGSVSFATTWGGTVTVLVAWGGSAAFPTTWGGSVEMCGDG